MRPKLWAVLVGVALALGASRVHAQGVVYRVPTTTYTSFYYAPAHYDAGALGTTYVRPNSYYLAPYGWPAREYVGIGGANDFPFYGQPWGNPSEPWSWPYIGTYPNPQLFRYYYPPVP